MARFTIAFPSFDKKHKPTTTDLIIRIPLTSKQLKMLFDWMNIQNEVND